jgi:hypothetical protein
MKEINLYFDYFFKGSVCSYLTVFEHNYHTYTLVTSQGELIFSNIIAIELPKILQDLNHGIHA